MQVYGTGMLHAVFFIQDHFGWNATDGRRDGRYGCCREVFDGGIASEDDDRFALVGRRKTVETNIAAAYS